MLLQSQVRQIEADRVSLTQDGRDFGIDNDAVIINAGGILPTGFLREIGVEVNTKFGEA